MKLLVGLDAIVDDTQSMQYPASNWCIDDFAVLVCPVILVPDINRLKMPYGSVFQAVQISERRPAVGRLCPTAQIPSLRPDKCGL